MRIDRSATLLPTEQSDSSVVATGRQCAEIRFGLMEGQIKIADDFDAPLPAELLDLFEQ